MPGCARRWHLRMMRRGHSICWRLWERAISVDTELTPASDCGAPDRALGSSSGSHHPFFLLTQLALAIARADFCFDTFDDLDVLPIELGELLVDVFGVWFVPAHPAEVLAQHRCLEAASTSGEDHVAENLEIARRQIAQHLHRDQLIEHARL